MNWWESRKHIFAREYIRLNAEWQDNNFKFFEKEGFLWLSGTLKLPTKYNLFINFEFELKYPQNYPFSIPTIYPKDRKYWLDKHQYKSSAFCLDVREKSWSSSLSSVDIIKSLYNLLISTIDSIEKNKDDLEVYEEKEPTKLDNVVKKINCIVPSNLLKEENSHIGDFKYFNSFGINDDRLIVIPVFSETKELINSEYFKIWGTSLFLVNKGIWLRLNHEQLQRIVYLNDIDSFKNFITEENILLEQEYLEMIENIKSKYIIVICDNRAVLLSCIDYENKSIEYSGCYNLDLSNLFDRIPNIEGVKSLNKKTVTIIGCGSGGSFIAEELVKSGVSKIYLIDEDIMSVQNIIRHSCDLRDIGLKKIYALKNKLQKINPKVEIVCFDYKINIIPNFIDEKIKESDLIINATAEIEEIVNEYCWQNNIPSIYLKVFPLGFGGEIFRVIPKITPCFECLNASLEEVLKKRDGYNNFPKYDVINYNETFEGDIISIPSLSIDAKNIYSISVKMALEILCSDLLNDFKNRPNIFLYGNKKMWIFSQDYECLKIDTSNFISYKNCIVCYGCNQIEKELNLSTDEIDIFVDKIKIKDDKN